MFQFKTEVTETCNKYATEHGEQVQAVMNETAKNATDIMKISERLASMETTLALHRGDIETNKTTTNANADGIAENASGIENIQLQIDEFNKKANGSCGRSMNEMNQTNKHIIDEENKKIVSNTHEIQASRDQMDALVKEAKTKCDNDCAKFQVAHETTQARLERAIKISNDRIEVEEMESAKRTVKFMMCHEN